MLEASDILALRSQDSDGMFGGNGNGAWVFFLFFLLAWGNGGLFGGRDSAGMNQITNDFLYTNLNSTIDQGFGQIANQGFNIQRSVDQGTCAINANTNNIGNMLNTTMWNGFQNVGNELANNRFSQQECCCTTNRNIDSVRNEICQSTTAITNAIHCEAEETRDLINSNTIQNLRDRLADRDRDLIVSEMLNSQQYQTQNLVNTLRPFPQPAYITCSPYTSSSMYSGCSGTCGCNSCSSF